MLKRIVTLMFCSIILYANGKPNDVDKAIMDLSLNYEFDKAEQLFTEQFHNNESLKKHFIYLNVELLKVIRETDNAPYSQKRAVKDSLNQLLVEYSEKVIDKYEDEDLSIYDRFYLGSIYGLLGRFYGVSRSWMSAFSAGKDGRNIMEEVIEEDPNFTDAYLLLGMMNYYADRLGGFTEFVAGILGLSGDRDVGLNYLKKVEQDGKFNNWQATMILIELYSRLEGNKFESLPLLEKIVKRFPENKHFVNWLCYEYINLHQLDKAKEFMMNTNHEYINDFVWATYYHQIGEYVRSNEIYDTLLTSEGKVWPWVLENAKYTRALNYYLLGKKEEAVSLSKNLNEIYSNRWKELTNSPEAFIELQKLKIAVSLNDKQEFDMISRNSSLFNENSTAKGAYNYYTAVYHFRNNNLAKAEEYFLKAKEISFDDYAYPTSQYLIHIYKNINVSIDKVEKLLDDIDDLDNDGLSFFAQDLELKYDL